MASVADDTKQQVEHALQQALNFARQRHFHSSIACLEGCRTAISLKVSVLESESPLQENLSKQLETLNARLKPLLDKLKNDPYLALKLNRDCGIAQVKKAYRSLALVFHPDKNGGSTVELFQVIQGAFESLRTNPTVASKVKPKQRQTERNKSTPPDREVPKQKNEPFKGRAANSRFQQRHYDRQKQRQHQYESNPTPPAAASNDSNRHSDTAGRSGFPIPGRKQTFTSQHTKQKQQAPSNPSSTHKSEPMPSTTRAESNPADAEEKLKEFWKSVQQSESWDALKRAAIEQANKEAAKARKRTKAFRTTNGNTSTKQHFPKVEIYQHHTLPKHREDGTAESKQTSNQHQTANETTCNPSQEQGPNDVPRVPQEPDAPTGLQMRSRSSRSITLSWNREHQSNSRHEEDHVVCYELQFRQGIFPWVTAGSSIKSTICRKNNLEPGCEYSFKVRACSKAGVWGMFGYPMVFATGSEQPGAVRITSVYADSLNSVIITWDPAIENGSMVYFYELQYRLHDEGTEQPWISASTSVRGTACRKKNIVPGNSYKFRVRAQNEVGWGQWSEETLPHYCQPVQDETWESGIHNPNNTQYQTDPYSQQSHEGWEAWHEFESGYYTGENDTSYAAATEAPVAYNTTDQEEEGAYVTQIHSDAADYHDTNSTTKTFTDSNGIVNNYYEDTEVTDTCSDEKVHNETPLEGAQYVQGQAIYQEGMTETTSSEVQGQNEVHHQAAGNYDTDWYERQNIGEFSKGNDNSNYEQQHESVEQAVESVGNSSMMHSSGEDKTCKTNHGDAEFIAPREYRSQSLESSQGKGLKVQSRSCSAPSLPTEEQVTNPAFPKTSDDDSVVVEDAQDSNTNKHDNNDVDDMDVPWSYSCSPFHRTVVLESPVTVVASTRKEEVFEQTDSTRPSATSVIVEENSDMNEIPLEQSNTTSVLSEKPNTTSVLPEKPNTTLERLGHPDTASASNGASTDQLPEGWIAVPSRSRPGEFSYENTYTKERQVLIPTAPAHRVRAGALSPPPTKQSPVVIESQILVNDPQAGILPAGWVPVPSRSRPGEFSYENTLTGERQVLFPTQPAIARVAESKLQEKINEQPTGSWFWGAGKEEEAKGNGIGILSEKLAQHKFVEGESKESKSGDQEQPEILPQDSHRNRHEISSHKLEWDDGFDDEEEDDDEEVGAFNDDECTNGEVTQTTDDAIEPALKVPCGDPSDRNGTASVDGYSSSSDESTAEGEEDLFRGEVWLELRHENRLYYYNTHTGYSTSERPSDPHIPIIPEANIVPPA